MDVLAALTRRLGADRVLGPTDAAPVLSGAYFHEVRQRRPAAVVRPATFDDVRAALGVLADFGAPATVLGGGHGPRCVADGAVCLDLRSIPCEASAEGEAVRINGSGRVADLLAAAPEGRVVPVGVTDSPGMGLLTTGGVGGLSRSLGLSIDSLRSVDLLLADGQPLTVTAQSPAELWWAVRGGAARLGVVRFATFATHPVPEVTETQILARADVLAAWAAAAPSAPRTASLSWMLSPATDGSEPLALIDELSAGRDPGLARAVVPVGQRMRERTWRHRYRDFADVNVPVCSWYGPPAVADLRMRRIAPLLSGTRMPQVLEEVIRHVRNSPTPWCRVEVQHIGGAVGDVAEHDSAFSGRDAEYAVMAAGAWRAESPVQARAIAWVEELDDILAPARVGRYLTEVEAGLPGLADRVREGVHWLARHPEWPLGAALLIVLLRPGRALRWASFGLQGYALYRRAQRVMARPLPPAR